MKILNVVCSSDPEHGGVIEWIRQFGPIAQELGHTVHIASMDSPDAPWLADFPLKVHALDHRLRYFHSPRLVPWLREHAAHYDAVIAHGLWRYASFGTWRALAGTNTPYFVYTHGMLDPWFKHHYPLKHLGKWLYWPWADYRVLRDAKGTIFTCERERIKARQSFWLYKTRELVSTLGIRPPEGDACAQREQFHRQFPETRNKRLLLFLGRIHEKKGIDLLLSALAGQRDREDIHLVMAGPVPEDDLARFRQFEQANGLAGRITWTGMIKGDIKWGAYHAAEAFTLPSHQENFGISVVEAMACSVPVLISDKVDIYTEIEQDKAGYIEPDTLEGTRRLLARWLDTSPQALAQMKTNARHCYLERFDSLKATRDLMALIAGQIAT